MQKLVEQQKPDSCWNKATPHELVFVLLGRDEAASYAIVEWCRRRVALSKNTWEDDQILEALNIAHQMTQQREADQISKEQRQLNNHVMGSIQEHLQELAEPETVVVLTEQGYKTEPAQ